MQAFVNVKVLPSLAQRPKKKPRDINSLLDRGLTKVSWSYTPLCAACDRQDMAAVFTNQGRRSYHL